MPTIAEVFSLAWRHHQAGGFAQAEQLYRQVLQADPSHTDAWCFLGAACQSQGRLAEAEDGFRRALQFAPNQTSALNCLGVLLANQGRLSEATACFEQGVRYEPRSPEMHNNLALALARQGRFDEATRHYHKAIQLKPDYSQAYYNLGLALNAEGKRQAAIEQFQAALRLQPNYPEALNDLGNALGQQDKLEDAILCYQQALGLRPNYAEVHYNLGVVLGKQNKHHAALFHYQQALRHKPDYAEAHMNLANVLHGLWRFDEAIDAYKQALRSRPNFAEAVHGMGGVYLRQGRLEEAVASFKEALRLQPDSAALCSNVLFCMNYDPNADLDSIFAEHCRFGEMLERSQKSAECEVRSAKSQGRHLTPHSALCTTPVLRVGYVSPDLRYHALARYLEPVLAHHDKEQVQAFCYAEVPTPDSVTVRLQKLAHGWRLTCGLTDAQVAEQIRKDQIDIIVDLAGHTANNRLGVFALKPAPVQATWLGYMNTTGLRTIDYRITDEVLDPPGQPRRDTEELFCLPHGMCCFAPPADAPDVSPLPALASGALTFGSLHNLFKLNASVYDLWSRLLISLPRSRLIMFRHTLIGTAREYVFRQFAERGIGSEQLELRQGSDSPGYLGIYSEIDVGLDTFPYTGGVTTCESLWMGVPVLSLLGERPAGRNSAAILARVGLSDWAVRTPEEYLEFALGLSKDLSRLTGLRAKLRERTRASLCDAGRFTRELEETYRTMLRSAKERRAADVRQPVPQTNLEPQT
jgi:predicted O-linked N-acetylglucosamine transferase (SPINDLY family)